MAWFVTRLMILLRISYSVYMETDIKIYYKYAGGFLSGLMPYRDFNMEYPPGALLCFIVPKLLAGNILAYRQFFVVQMMLAELIGLLLVLYYGRKKGFSPGFSYLTAVFYVALPVIMGFTVYQRFDFIPAILVLAAVVLAVRGRRVPAWALLGIGFAVKLYPVILIPVFLLQVRREKALLKRDLLLGLPAFAAGVSVLWLPFLFSAGRKFWFFLSYHGQRGIQLESYYAVGLMVARWLGYHITTEFSYGSWNIVSGISPLLAGISLPVMACLMLLVLSHFFFGRNKNSLPGDLPRQALLMVMAFIIGGKVFSPQYLVWLMPLLVIALDEVSPYRKPIWGAFALLVLLSFLIYPVSYKGMIELRLWPSILLLLRNGLLLCVFYFLLKTGTASRPPRNINEK